MQESRIDDDSLPKLNRVVTGSVSVLKYLAHFASRHGRINLLVSQLKQGKSALQIDKIGRMPIHYACLHDNETKSVKMVQTILKQIQSLETRKEYFVMKCLEHEDNNGETPLQIAIRMDHSNVAIELMSAQKAYNKYKAVPFQWTEQNKKHPEILKQIFEVMPDVLLPFLNGAVQCNEDDRFNKELNLTIDFEMITGNITKEKKSSSSLLYQEETKWLVHCLKCKKNSNLLRHPVVQTFLHEKRSKIKSLLRIYIATLMLWLSLNTMLTVYFFVFLCPYKFDKFNHGSSSNESTRTGPDIFTTVSCSPGGSYLPLVMFSLAFFSFSAISAIVSVVLELCSFLKVEHENRKIICHFFSFEFIGSSLYFILVLNTYTPVLLQIAAGRVTICVWQYIASACTILLAWLIVIVQLFKLSTFAVYIAILWKILSRILKIIGLFAPLLIPFAISLKILMPENPEFQFPWVLLKVLVMMVGELNYHETFYTEDYNSKPLNLVPFPNSTKVIYAAFLTVVAITFFNILLGVTLTDIKDLHQSLKKNMLTKKLKEINIVERILFSRIVRHFLNCIGEHDILRQFLVTTCDTEAPANAKVMRKIQAIKPELRGKIRKIAIPPEPTMTEYDLVADHTESSENDVVGILAKMREDLNTVIENMNTIQKKFET